jgi:hypothetical protein
MKMIKNYRQNNENPLIMNFIKYSMKTGTMVTALRFVIFSQKSIISIQNFTDKTLYHEQEGYLRRFSYNFCQHYALNVINQ